MTLISFSHLRFPGAARTYQLISHGKGRVCPSVIHMQKSPAPFARHTGMHMLTCSHMNTHSHILLTDIHTHSTHTYTNTQHSHIHHSHSYTTHTHTHHSHTTLTQIHYTHITLTQTHCTHTYTHTHSTVKLKLYRIRYHVTGMSPPLGITAGFNQPSILVFLSCRQMH